MPIEQPFGTRNLAIICNDRGTAFMNRLWNVSSSQPDKIVEKVHLWRKNYAAQFDNDLDRIFADLKSKEADNPARRVESKPVKPQRRREKA